MMNNISMRKASNTKLFEKVIKHIDKLNIGLNLSGMCELLQVHHSTLKNWERNNLIFPSRVNNHARQYRYKDVLRGVTIKYLMGDMGYRKFKGVKTLLIITSQAVDNKTTSIDNVEIDKYLMKILNYDVDLISQSRHSSNCIPKSKHGERYKNKERMNDNIIK